ncbi:antirestriction protein, partial [Salmonella enterica subsp. enterica serovar Panama]|nr:antirestriction protein [Salmonella enterica subsp. enterica serovar Panama]
MTTVFNPEFPLPSDDPLITATPVEDENRPDFWPRHFRG